MTPQRIAAPAALFALAALAGPAPAPAQTQERPAGIDIELNKLEAAGTACRGYFVITNGTADALKELRLDVFLFDRSGIILRRAGLTFLDVRAERTKVVPFDFPEVSCTGIGRLTVNDVLACTAASGAPVVGCADRIRVTTRAGAGFSY
jgi:hypothetical protein